MFGRLHEHQNNWFFVSPIYDDQLQHWNGKNKCTNASTCLLVCFCGTTCACNFYRPGLLSLFSRSAHSDVEICRPHNNCRPLYTRAASNTSCPVCANWKTYPRLNGFKCRRRLFYHMSSFLSSNNCIRNIQCQAWIVKQIWLDAFLPIFFV